jgi:DNA invertase Pin-like site-specific DNA recombinase
LRSKREQEARRLTLNVLLSFAQFEREVTGEREFAAVSGL